MRITNDTPFHSFGQYLKGMFKESKGVVVQETLDNPFDRKHFRLIDNRRILSTVCFSPRFTAM